MTYPSCGTRSDSGSMSTARVCPPAVSIAIVVAMPADPIFLASDGVRIPAASPSAALSLNIAAGNWDERDPPLTRATAKRTTHGGQVRSSSTEDFPQTVHDPILRNPSRTEWARAYVRVRREAHLLPSPPSTDITR
jgi:hypothetical protein